MLEKININKLFPHPDNPRKEIGDVSELADSIKQNGVFQNLTVVVGGKGVPKGADGFTVIIGHRRLAAAKIAGVSELMCSIVEMSETKQVETMLLENMQRSDLTAYEQAQGFQMLLDLGETQQSIAEKTGFSPATVSRRIKLLQIKSAAFKDTQGKNLSIDDLLKVAELKSKKAQQEALKAAGTSNFNNVVSRLLTDQKNKEVRPLVLRELGDIGARELKSYSETWNGKYYSLKTVMFSEYKQGELDKSLKVAADTPLFYYLSLDRVTLYKKTDPLPKKKAPKKSPEEVAADVARENLKTVTKRMFELRRDFILNFGATKKNMEIILEWFSKTWAKRNTRNYYPSSGTALMKTLIKEGKEFSNFSYSIDEDAYLIAYAESPERFNLLTAYCFTGDSEDERYYSPNYQQRFPEHNENERLDLIYSFLCRLGYEMSDEEKQLQDGTHPLFNQKSEVK